MTEFIGLDFEMEIKEHYTEASRLVPAQFVGLLGLALLAVFPSHRIAISQLPSLERPLFG
jgi:hypothetical protein